MRTAELGQNFLRNQRTARKLVKMAGGTPDMPCVDLGAGKGIITTSALLRGGARLFSSDGVDVCRIGLQFFKREAVLGKRRVLAREAGRGFD